jgi:cytochrome c oxidase subunit II
VNDSSGGRVTRHQPSSRRSGRSPARRRTVLTCLPLLGLTACRFAAPGGATTQGQAIGNLYHMLWYFAIPVAVIVYGLVAWSLLRYRAGAGKAGSKPGEIGFEDLPKQTRVNIPLEVTYTLIPIFMVVALFVLTDRTERTVDAVAANPKLVVEVDAFQWQWRFTYPAQHITVVGTPGDVPVLNLPTGETVEIVLRSEDVVHAFYVSDFLFQRQAIPGITNRFDLTIPAPGTWRGACSLYCGLDHTSMDFSVHAMIPGDFQSWVHQQAVKGATV